MSGKAFALAALFTVAPLRALAWGPEGHEIVAHIAARELSPRARAEVSALLGGSAEAMMVTTANWADEIRDARPETTRWHFVNIELDTPGFERRRDCRDGDCVVVQIESDVRTLGDRKRSRAARAEALRFLVHFLADIHQPLHAADNHDRGGNDIKVRLGRGRTPANLHRVWDSTIVEAFAGADAGIAAGQVAARFPPRQRAAWRSGTPVEWANESFHLARREIYAGLPGHRRDGRPILLSRDYLVHGAAPARLRLMQAGVRLGWLLNTILG